MGDRNFATIVPVRRREDETTEDWHRRATDEGDGWSNGFCFGRILFKNEHAYLRDVDAGTISFPTKYVLDVHARPMQLRTNRWQRNPTSLIDNHFTSENWRKMGTHLAQLPRLRTLDLSGTCIGADGLASLFQACLDLGVRLQHLRFHDCEQFRPSCLAAAMPFLKSQSHMSELDLKHTKLGDEGAELVSEALEHCCVRDLSLANVQMTDDGLMALLNAKNAIHVRALDLKKNRFSKPGFEALSSFLQKEDAKLKRLEFDCTVTDWFVKLIGSLPKESKLTTVLGSNRESQREAVRKLSKAVHKFVCDTTSFESLCQSNHSLFKCGISSKAISSGKHKLALKLNARNVPKSQILQDKLRAFYFRHGRSYASGCNFDLTPFRNIGVALMPRLLELLAWDDVCLDTNPRTSAYHRVRGGNLNGMYRLVRNLHTAELFGFPSQAGVLASKNSLLEGDNGRLREENEELRRESAKMKEMIQQLTAQNTKRHISDKNVPNKRVRPEDGESGSF